MIERKAIVRNAHGIHCRPSAVIIKAADGYDGCIRIMAREGESDLRSALSLIALALEKGAEVRIRVEGEGEEAFCRRLVELFEAHFDFPPLLPKEQSPVLGTMPAAIPPSLPGL